MKMVRLLLLLILTLTSCLSLGGRKDDAPRHPTDDPDRSAEAVGAGGVDGATAAESDAVVAGSDKGTQEKIIAAVQALDLDSLKALLSDVDDVKKVVGDDVLLLHMAEDAMGVGGLENPVARLLVEKGAYVLQRDENGRSWERVVLDMEAAATPRHEYVATVIGDKFQQRYNAMMADDLTAFKRYVHDGPMDGRLLWEASRAKAAEIAVYLVEQGADPNFLSLKERRSALHEACSRFVPSGSAKDYTDFAPIVNALLNAGADVNAVDSSGVSPLLELMKTELLDNPDKLGDPANLVWMLVEAGADPSIPDSVGDTALESSVRDRNSPNPAIVEILLDSGAEISDRIVGTDIVNLSIIQLLIAHGADIHAMARTPRTFFDDEAGQLQYYRYMISIGADADDFDLRRSLAYAKNARYLIELGADISVRYHKGKTLLHIAVQNNFADIVDVLIAAGAQINALDDDGLTPLDALQYGQKRIEAALKGAGAVKGAQLASVPEASSHHLNSSGREPH